MHKSCNHKTDRCSGNCDHTCPLCERNNCPIKCHHKCKNCQKFKVECNEYFNMYNGNCSICLECNEKFFEQLVNKIPTTSSPCPSFVYHYCLKLLLEFRNFFSHLTLNICENFLKGKNVINIGRFSFKTEGELKEFLLTVFQLIWNHIFDPLEMTHPFTHTEKDQFLEKINLILQSNESLSVYTYKNTESIKQRLETVKEMSFSLEKMYQIM